MFRQKCPRLSVPPNSVVKMVESASRMSPPRPSVGGIHTHELNSRFPTAVNGCGVRDGRAVSRRAGQGKSRMRTVHARPQGGSSLIWLLILHFVANTQCRREEVEQGPGLLFCGPPGDRSK